MRSRVLPVVLSVALVAACTSAGDEAEPLKTFMSGSIEYEFGISPNQQGAEAPCVGVTVDLDGGGRRTAMACPTEDEEETEYAAAVELPGWIFVVGYGLRQGEEIAFEDAVRVISTEEVDGRRFFLIQLAELPAGKTFEIPVTGSEGTTRAITSYGLAD